MTSVEMLEPKVPHHVPAELVWDHNLDEFTHELDDPYLAASRLHEGPGIIWATVSSLRKPGWVLTRHALIQEAFLDYEHFSSTRGSTNSAVLGPIVRLIPVEVDPPEHHAYRQILTPFFTPSAVNSLEAPVREVCDSLISKFADRGACEFIGQFGQLFPNSIFLTLMGMPQAMLPQFLEWEQIMLRGGDDAEHVAAAGAVFRYLQSFIAEQRTAPKTDLMKGIVGGKIGGRLLSEEEILGTCFLLYVGGLDTVYSSLGWIMRHLAGDQSLQERLRANPQEIPSAIEELTRAFAVAAPHRRIAKDFIFHGVPMRKDDDVLLPTYLAARDPRAYENPHVIDIGRRARSVTFATGPHTCLGIHLAKREIRVVLEAFLSRFKNIRIPQGEAYEYHTGGVLGVDRLPLEWDR
ncbi:MAG: cytochrome P450 [Rhizomicrobium sp.]